MPYEKNILVPYNTYKPGVVGALENKLDNFLETNVVTTPVEIKEMVKQSKEMEEHLKKKPTYGSMYDYNEALKSLLNLKKTSPLLHHHQQQQCFPQFKLI